MALGHGLLWLLDEIPQKVQATPLPSVPTSLLSSVLLPGSLACQQGACVLSRKTEGSIPHTNNMK